jgi:hypothetical protein
MVARSVVAMAIALGVFVAISGCAASGAPAGTVTGHVVNYGGPYNAKTHKGAMDGLPAVGHAVELKSAGRVVAHGVTSGSGAFTFTVRPGKYQVSSICGSVPITVTAGVTTKASLKCLYP